MYLLNNGWGRTKAIISKICNVLVLDIDKLKPLCQYHSTGIEVFLRINKITLH